VRCAVSQLLFHGALFGGCVQGPQLSVCGDVHGASVAQARFKPRTDSEQATTTHPSARAGVAECCTSSQTSNSTARCACAEFLRQTMATGDGSEPMFTGKIDVAWLLCSAAECAQQVSRSVCATTDRL
jgi:hypothetical protein